ncbi:hypothetical protein GE061_010689 [Apolygus lucorum]|uniref:Uncharacterized protein n=1 Tax=Apolygus lucorum TaxID=248454 RepID=A0A6A4IR76_APOLU|nr:hypothetical protein GE061_010689 [Apolygus lucorum]
MDEAEKDPQINLFFNKNNRMVRVISVHHFDSQVIQTCEEPLAATSAPPDRILTALPHHVIEVHDLTQRGQPPFSFPTVDRVQELRYCITGI